MMCYLLALIFYSFVANELSDCYLQNGNKNCSYNLKMNAITRQGAKQTVQHSLAATCFAREVPFLVAGKRDYPFYKVIMRYIAVLHVLSIIYCNLLFLQLIARTAPQLGMLLGIGRKERPRAKQAEGFPSARFAREFSFCFHGLSFCLLPNQKA